jgi:hypothetical protein
MSRNRRPWGAIALIALGVVLLLGSVGAYDLGDLMGLLWPVLLVLVGVKLVMGNRSGGDRERARHGEPASGAAPDSSAPDSGAPGASGQASSAGPSGGAAADEPAADGLAAAPGRGDDASGEGAFPLDRLQESCIFGDAKVRVHSRDFAGGAVSTVFGDTRIDLTLAQIAEGEHMLRVNGVFGDAKILLPSGLAISVSARTTLGDLDVLEQEREGFSPSLHIESPGYASAPRRLRIVVSQVFGDVTVRETVTLQ